jgi:integrase
MQRRRLQKGSLTLRSGQWYVRYLDGADRRMVSHRLHAKDDVHYGKSSTALRALMAGHMAKVNARVHEEGPPPVSVAEFWEETYFPWVELNKKNSTRLSYSQIWAQHLKAHFDGHMLTAYRTSDASKLLTSLAETGLNRNTVSHVRSLMSGLFSHAINLGLLDRNPIADAKSLSKMKPPGKTESYSLREVEDLISALADRTDCQLLVALCGFLGLRPSEACGLAWDSVDLGQGVIHLRRGVVRGVVGDLKTEGSVASLPLIEPVLSIFKLWASKSAPRKWVFESASGTPKDLKELVRRQIKPAIAKWNAEHEEKIAWKSLYALRRTAASLLWGLTGSVEASQQVLRHQTPAVTMRHYLKADRSELVRGLKLLEASVGKRQ